MAQGCNSGFWSALGLACKCWFTETRVQEEPGCVLIWPCWVSFFLSPAPVFFICLSSLLLLSLVFIFCVCSVLFHVFLPPALCSFSSTLPWGLFLTLFAVTSAGCLHWFPQGECGVGEEWDFNDCSLWTNLLDSGEGPPRTAEHFLMLFHKHRRYTACSRKLC